MVVGQLVKVNWTALMQKKTFLTHLLKVLERGSLYSSIPGLHKSSRHVPCYWENRFSVRGLKEKVSFEVSLS